MTKKKEPEEKDERAVAEDQEKEPVNEEEALRKLQDTVNRMPVADLVGSMLLNLAATSYVKLGLPAETNASYKDLEQAKQAIDCLDALVRSIEPALQTEEADSYRQTVANLKLAYVKASDH